ncbi:AAA domain-containing protein [Helicobacter cetorum]|uniref:Uncharacterized protein n=1 Tax=Helicobacter cetorum (strain ATCC BAA-429 / MIT 00-7128) TaxID=182217 RepID=I0ENY8_HELC0|nr:C-terminal helicase domain-containing protein [Helicobacter cetorum]AFI04657.1 hypothetical protein HCW_06995 [Helicobacter cetorum MIT 00-7128]
MNEDEYYQNIGIITPFVNQEIAIKERFKEYSDLEIGTVHKFQGSEKKIILFSSVYNTNDIDAKNFFFNSTDASMINVAITRAKEVFVLFGNKETLHVDETHMFTLTKHIEHIDETYMGVPTEHILDEANHAKKRIKTSNYHKEWKYQGWKYECQVAKYYQERGYEIFINEDSYKGKENEKYDFVKENFSDLFEMVCNFSDHFKDIPKNSQSAIDLICQKDEEVLLIQCKDWNATTNLSYKKEELERFASVKKSANCQKILVFSEEKLKDESVKLNLDVDKIIYF